MSARPQRVAVALLVALIAALAVARADQPTATPIDLEFEPVEAPGLKDLKRSGQYPPPTFSTPGGLPPEILRVQQELGGSVVNQFPSLQSTDAPSAPAAPSTANRQAVVAALRDAAWSMDSWANRLESLEAYDQADALRAHAQRLRLAARADGVSPANAASAPQPAPAFNPAPAVEISPAATEAEPTELR